MGHFDALSDIDFEHLVADLMTADRGLAYRAGTRGPDAGIDVLARDEAGLHVIQCKHYRDSTYSQLRRDTAKEAERLRRRQARFASYSFATSRQLSHRQQAEIARLLDRWIETPEQVLGEGDLMRLLREHPEVEQRHVKLWLATAGALRTALNARSYQRSLAGDGPSRSDVVLRAGGITPPCG